MMNDVTILVVEDEPLIAEDIAMILQEQGYQLSGIAHTYEEAIHELNTNPPDLAILDVNLNGVQDGVHIGAHILEKHELPIIYLTAYADKKTIDRAKYTRPMGYIVKPFDAKDIFSTIEIALYNYAQLLKPLQFDRQLLNEKVMSPVTEKEFEILIDIYEGKTNRQLAEKHFVSINTVKTHVKHLYDKMHVSSRTEAIVSVREIFKAI